MDQETDVHLRWNNHQNSILSVFTSLLDNGSLVDCTVSAEGQHFKAHRVILSACSPYFESLFSQHYEKHPIVILPEVNFQILKTLLQFMYSGEIKVAQDKLCTVLELAETLQIKGLSITGESDKVDCLGPKRRSEGDQQGFAKRQCNPRFVSQVDQRDVSSLHTSETVCSDNTSSHLLTTNKCTKNSHSSVSPEKTFEEPAMSQDIGGTGINVAECSAVAKTFSKSNTRVSVSNIIDINQLPGPSKENIRKQVKLTENVILTCLSSEEMRTSKPQSTSREKTSLDHAQEIKQKDPDNFHGNSVEEIILDDDADESDDRIRGFGDENSNTFGGLVRVTGEESCSGQGSLEEFRDPYFVEPPLILRNRLRCNACGRSYKYHNGLVRHLKYECGKEPQFSCSHCPMKYTQRHHLTTHMLRCHSSSLGINLRHALPF